MQDYESCHVTLAYTNEVTRVSFTHTHKRHQHSFVVAYLGQLLITSNTLPCMLTQGLPSVSPICWLQRRDLEVVAGFGRPSQLLNAHLVVSGGLRPLTVPANCAKFGEKLGDPSFLVAANAIGSGHRIRQLRTAAFKKTPCPNTKRYADRSSVSLSVRLHRRTLENTDL